MDTTFIPASSMSFDGFTEYAGRADYIYHGVTEYRGTRRRIQQRLLFIPVGDRVTLHFIVDGVAVFEVWHKIAMDTWRIVQRCENRGDTYAAYTPLEGWITGSWS